MFNCGDFFEEISRGHSGYNYGCSGLRDNEEVNIRFPINTADGRVRIWARTVGTDQLICDSNVWECRNPSDVLSL